MYYIVQLNSSRATQSAFYRSSSMTFLTWLIGHGAEIILKTITESVSCNALRVGTTEQEKHHLTLSTKNPSCVDYCQLMHVMSPSAARRNSWWTSRCLQTAEQVSRGCASKPTCAPQMPLEQPPGPIIAIWRFSCGCIWGAWWVWVGCGSPRWQCLRHCCCTCPCMLIGDHEPHIYTPLLTQNCIAAFIQFQTE